MIFRRTPRGNSVYLPWGQATGAFPAATPPDNDGEVVRWPALLGHVVPMRQAVLAPLIGAAQGHASPNDEDSSAARSKIALAELLVRA